MYRLATKRADMKESKKRDGEFFETGRVRFC